MSLSPDGKNVAFIAPTEGQGARVLTIGLEKGATARVALVADGKPSRLRGCQWISNTRLTCTVYAVIANPPLLKAVTVERIFAVDIDGKNPKQLGSKESAYSRGFHQGGGEILGYLPGEDGTVLMAREYLPDDHTGSRLGSTDSGLGVDWLDTRTLKSKRVEPPNPGAFMYLTDGHGTVRIMGLVDRHADMDTGELQFLYRQADSHDWHTLGSYNRRTRTGFYPLGVDHDQNKVYGLKKKDGRDALYTVALDGSLHEEPVYARPDVDVDELITVGRQRRIVGAAYAADIRYAIFFAPDIEKLSESLHKALNDAAVEILDASLDESKLLIFAESDDDPGVYYILDRNTHQLQTFLVARNELEGVKLAHTRPITYPAADGVGIPAYLTLPPGKESAKGLPAVVLPHGGPSARDEWGFDWLSEFYASRGYAVLRPNFRGSSGYGDAWFRDNGFKAWQIAIGDVLDAGRWLVSQGIADPSQLAIVGWSYGGYAALQSAVYDPSVFKAVVAIAPVTDLSALKEESRNWSNYDLVSDFIGEGRHMHEGSPAEHADKIKVPVLLFHGTSDANVGIEQSRHMAQSLKSAGAPYELVTYEGLDHYLEDSTVRQEMLHKSDEFLRQALKMQ